MDSSRFDDLTRSLSMGFTRRATLAAAVLGALGWRHAAGAQVSQAQCGNKTCKNNPGKCNDGCVCCDHGNGNTRCRPPGGCGADQVVCPAERPIYHPVFGCIASTAGNGAVDPTDPAFPLDDERCSFDGNNYDPTVIQHAGGPLSLKVRGINTPGGGTLFDPVLYVYAGTDIPQGDLCGPRAAQNDDYCCVSSCDVTVRDPYIETSLPAGTYTAIVFDFSNQPGTYFLEVNQFNSYCSV